MISIVKHNFAVVTLNVNVHGPLLSASNSLRIRYVVARSYILNEFIIKVPKR